MASSETAPTVERRPFPLFTGIAEVVRVTTLTPKMARITLGGTALDNFFVEEPGEIVTLLWPAPGEELVLPERGWRFRPGVADIQHARNYTVRRWDATARELDVDFVLHGDHGQASRWADAARAGDRIGFAGPRTHWTSDGTADWTLLVADETGLPALAAIAEELPRGHRTIALVEVADAAERQTLHVRARLDLRWRHRDGAPPGTTTLLADAVTALELSHRARPRLGRRRGAGHARGAPPPARAARPARRGGLRARLLEARHDARLGVGRIASRASCPAAGTSTRAPSSSSRSGAGSGRRPAAARP